MSEAASIDMSADTTPPRRGWGMLWTGLALTVLGPAAGLAGTVIGMMSSFHKIESERAPSPKDLSAGVYESLFATTAGLLLGCVGVVLLIVAVIRLSRAASTAPRT